MVNSRTKGLTAERAVANYFKVHVSPDARRSVATGWSNGSTEHQDLGDIDGVPGLCLSVKNLARRLEGKLLADTWTEVCRQALPNLYTAIIIEKRAGTTDVGKWWAHLSSSFYVELLTGRRQLVLNHHLVRVELGAIIDDLRLWCRDR